MKILKIKTKSKSYNIYIGHNIIANLNKIINKEQINFKKSLIIVDRKIPQIFLKKIKSNLNCKKKIISLKDVLNKPFKNITFKF